MTFPASSIGRSRSLCKLQTDNTAVQSYDEIPFPSEPYPQSHPDRLATIGRLFGMNPPPVDRCRVLELGCADGSNLIPMAVGLPKSEFTGVDLSEGQAAQARETISALQLKNIDVHKQSILELDDAGDAFDYIIAHGVYSWVPSDVQEKIFEIISSRLSAQGIAYVSYNTYPGWHFRGMLRDMMLYHSQQFTDTRTQIGQSRLLIRFLADSVPKENNPYGMLLNSQVEEMSRWDDAYLRHDALEEVNDPVYFHEFIEKAEGFGLQFLGESEFHTMLAGNLPAKVSETLHRIGRDIIQMEQYMDFVRNRMFRQTLLCRQDAPLNRNVKPESLREMSIASPLKPVAAQPDPAADSEEFRNELGISLTVTRPLSRAAFHILAEQWPKAISFSALLAEARTRFGELTAANFGEAEERGVSENLLACFSRNLIELHTLASNFVTTIGRKPVACPLARLHARSAGLVTNRKHDYANLDAMHQQLLLLLDGTRDERDLVNSLTDLVLEGKLTLQHSGTNVTEKEQIASLLSPQISPCLTHLAQSALLTG